MMFKVEWYQNVSRSVRSNKQFHVLLANLLNAVTGRHLVIPGLGCSFENIISIFSTESITHPLCAVWHVRRQQGFSIWLGLLLLLL